MSKELTIVFLYDCELCKKEEDDPQEAIIYFYPTWVSNEQRHALCSQLMGVSQFFVSTFSEPSIISLQSGKFALKKFGRYTLCVGTDRNILDEILKFRSDVLYNQLRLFHCNIEVIQSTLSEYDDNLNEKFSHILQAYLPILNRAVNIFDYVLTLKLPKSLSIIRLEAIQMLQSFQSSDGVLGGMILYNNKIVATQLDFGISKQLLISDPYRIKLPAQVIPLPLSVNAQLLIIYIDKNEAKRLESEASKFYQPNANKSDKGIPDILKDAISSKFVYKMENTPNYVTKAPELKESHTSDGIMTYNYIPMRYYSIGLPSIQANWCKKKEEPQSRVYYNTICDPQYPLFKLNGLPASYPLYKSRIDEKIENKGEALKNLKECDSNKKKQFSLPLQNKTAPQKALLTPLMEKLSLSTFADIDIDSKDDFKTPSSEFLPNLTSQNIDIDDYGDLEKKILFVIGHKNTCAYIVIEKSVINNQSTLDTLCEKILCSLIKIENRLASLNDIKENTDDYSYAVMDKNWGTIDTGGVLETQQVEILSSLHHTLNNHPNITDIVLCEEKIVSYAQQSNDAQVFYQQYSNLKPGVPKPADLIASIPIKAKKNLEKNHAIVLT